jgi:hypothetical protein
MFWRWLFCTALASIALAQQQPAETHPNFTGTWKLNETLSGSTPAGAHEIVFQIRHKDPDFRYSATGKQGMAPFSEAYEFTTDGKTPADSSKLSVTGRWDGAALDMRYVRDGKEIAKVLLRLSPDGKQMTRETEFANKRRIREIYDRQ